MGNIINITQNTAKYKVAVSLKNDKSIRLENNTKTQIAKNEILWADGLRGLAALAVAFGHCINVGRIGHAGVVPAEFKWMTLCATFAVPVFLFLSGFLLSTPAMANNIYIPNIKIFFEKRLNRILPAYWAACIMGILTSIYITHDTSWYQIAAYDPHIWNAFLLIQNFTGNAAYYNPPLWSMPIEGLAYLLMPAILVVFRKSGKNIGLAQVAVSSLLIDYMLAQTSLSNVGLWLIPAYTAGIWAANIQKEHEKCSIRISNTDLRWICPCAVGIITLLIMRNSDSPNLFMSDVLMGLSSILIWLWLTVDTKSAFFNLLTKPTMKWIGKISYSLYLFHYMVLQTIASFIPVNLSVTWTVIILALVGVPVSLLVAQVCWWLLERPYLVEKQKQNHTMVFRQRPTP